MSSLPKLKLAHDSGIHRDSGCEKSTVVSTVRCTHVLSRSARDEKMVLTFRDVQDVKNGAWIVSICQVSKLNLVYPDLDVILLVPWKLRRNEKEG